MARTIEEIKEFLKKLIQGESIPDELVRAVTQLKQDGSHPAFVMGSKDSSRPSILMAVHGEVKDFKVDSDGALTARVILSREGVLPYFDGNKTVYQLIPGEELSSPDFLSSINGKPVTRGHPPTQEVTMDSLSEYAVGALHNDFVAEKDKDNRVVVTGTETIWDKGLIKAIQDGKERQVSIGRWTLLVPDHGEFDGQKYDYRQTALRLNHVAHTNNGRQGDACRILVDMMTPLASQLAQLQTAEPTARVKGLIDAAKLALQLGDPDSISAVYSAVWDTAYSLKHGAELEQAAGVKGKYTTGYALFKKQWPGFKLDQGGAMESDAVKFEETKWESPASKLSPEDLLKCLAPAFQAWARAQQKKTGKLLKAYMKGPVRSHPGAPININAIRALIGGRGAAIKGVPAAVVNAARKWARSMLAQYHKMRGDEMDNLLLTVGEDQIDLAVDGLSDEVKTELAKRISDLQKKIDEALIQSDEPDEDLVKERDQLKAELEKTKKELDEAKKSAQTATSEGQGLKDELDALRKQIDEAKVDPAEIARQVEDEVNARAELLTAIQRFNPEYKLQPNVTTDEMRRELLVQVHPEDKETVMAKDDKGAFIKDENYVKARADYALELLRDGKLGSYGAMNVRPTPNVQTDRKKLDEKRQARSQLYKGVK